MGIQDDAYTDINFVLLMRIHDLRRSDRKTEEMCYRLSKVDLQIFAIRRSVLEIRRCPKVRPLVVKIVLCLDEYHVWRKELSWVDSFLYRYERKRE